MLESLFSFLATWPTILSKRDTQNSCFTVKLAKLSRTSIARPPPLSLVLTLETKYSRVN